MTDIEKYLVTIHFFDGKSETIRINSDLVQDFLTCVGKNEVFYSEQQNLWIWFPIDKIRYFTVKK